jgi:excisionase family DNA binding protein
MKSNNTLLTPEQVAKILQIHVLTVYSYIRQGKFDAVRLGRSYRIIPEDLDTFVESNKFKNNIKQNIHSGLPKNVSNNGHKEVGGRINGH